jgi:hypothetical protein
MISKTRLVVQWSGEAKLGDLAWRNPITGIARLLCPRRERPRRCRAAEKRDEVAAPDYRTLASSLTPLTDCHQSFDHIGFVMNSRRL